MSRGVMRDCANAQLESMLSVEFQTSLGPIRPRSQRKRLATTYQYKAVSFDRRVTNYCVGRMSVLRVARRPLVIFTERFPIKA